MDKTNEAAERLRESFGQMFAVQQQDKDLDEALAFERHRAFAEGMDDGRLVEQAACREKVAAERRATVERIRAQIEAARPFTWRRAHADPPTGHSTDIDLPVVLAILDEEAAR